jgi:site-specific recombinase XerD
VRDVLPRKHKSFPKFLSKEQVIALIKAAENPHHRLMNRFALQIGLRREEVATFLTIRQVIELDGSAISIRLKLSANELAFIRVGSQSIFADSL